MNPIVNRSLHWCGNVLSFAGVIFVALRLRDYETQIGFSHFDSVAWGGMAGLTLIYGLSNLMLALAWRSLLGGYGAGRSRSWAVRVYGISQITKYVPGNFFHLAGRQAMGMAAGVSGWALAKSSLWELALISATGALFGVLTLSLLVPQVSLTASAWIFVLVMFVAAISLWRFVDISAVRAFGWYIGFLVTSGLVFLGLVGLLAEPHESNLIAWLPMIGAYVLAWTVGMVTPGAPAGLGVRELVLLFLLNGMVSEADLLMIVIFARLVTAGGDSLFYFSSILIPRS